MKTKHCTKCGVEKPLEEFYSEKRMRDGRRSTCKSCDSIRQHNYRLTIPQKTQRARRGERKKADKEYQAEYRLRHRAKTLIRHARRRAEKRDLAFDLDDHVQEIQARIDAGHCEMTGIPFNLKMGRTFDSPSLDRKEPKQGYAYDNIRVVCQAMNCALGDWGEDTLMAVMDAWKEKVREQ